MSRRVITAKFNSVCAETGRTIKKGDKCIFDDVQRVAYAQGSKAQIAFVQAEAAKKADRDQGGDMLDAANQQAADNWYSKTYDR